MWIAGFDIGFKNFAFTVMEWKDNNFSIIDLQNIDITSSNKVGKDIAKDIIEVMDAYKSLWDQCDHFIIEQQMQFKHATNIKALKISQFVLCYLYIHYKQGKTIVDYPAYHKTQELGCPKGMKKYDRKKWIVEKIGNILKKNDQEYFLKGFSKADDVCDAIALCIAYATQNKL